ncbi:glyoxalase [Methylobacterium sp. Leaf399]|uniref:VOC family protein n=1 Tax=unclassified Methylobacterium TaxID=2615210 RepID=UPI0006F61E3A|nr:MULTISPECIES: VOC family protein [unclassified Methylobacterium]KQP60998.1 glyoxalase [Methylobacterium sp. Leaf108]KQT17202.1 glyoxalase [Methylobacterium sp. Leaf399]KQT77736.1 glyoxalase [Methylobacterium sp. Leaf466]
MADTQTYPVEQAGEALAELGPAIHLDHCVIHVTDWEVSTAFYRDVLGAEVVPAGAKVAFRFGGVQLNVHGPGQPGSILAEKPVMPGNSDLCFRWSGPIEGAVDHLARHGVPVELGPVERRGAAGVGVSVYFRDPDGSLMEFITYPPA